MPVQKIRVLVVDDSAVMRLRIKNILEKDKHIEAIGIARNGAEALEKIKELEPQVITMDVEMPVMNGLEALKYIMEHHPLPVIMLSALTTEGAEETLQALELGAVDFIQKPGLTDTNNLSIFEQELPEKIKVAVNSVVRSENIVPKKIKVDVSPHQKDIAVVAIGCSTGGPAALQQIIPFLPANFPAAVIVVQHIPKGFTKPLADRLDKISDIKVMEASDGMEINPGCVYIAPAGHVFSVRKNGQHVEVVLDAHETKARFRPAVDDMMISLSQIYGKKVLGVILTGMGNDGKEGMIAIKNAAGKTLAEAQSSCVVFGMPQAVIEAGVADEVADISNVFENILKMVKGS